MKEFLKTFHLSFNGLIHYLPALLGGIAVFILTIFASNFLSKIVSKYSLKRTKDSLIAHFIGKIVWAVIFILGVVLTLGILGLGTISNKILAGAGITTFVVGFALKDIGENFLAGLILAFSRPFRVGNLIECLDIKGVVKDMTLRQTTVEADNGKIVLIPNASIIKNPLSRYYNDDKLSQEFTVNVPLDDAAKAMPVIQKTVNSFDYVMKADDKRTRVLIDSLNGKQVKLRVIFWFDTTKFKGSRLEEKSVIMLKIFETLSKQEIDISG
jgi:small conductance mechanosensitive channel